MSQLLPIGLLALIPSTAAAAQAPAPDALAPRPVVLLRHDERAHEAWLAELAELRRARAHAAFEAELARGRDALEEARRDTVAWIESRGARVAEHPWLVDALVLEPAAPELLAEIGADARVLDMQWEAWREPGLKQAIDAAHHDAIGAHQSTIGGVPIEGAGIAVAIVDSGVDADMAGLGRPHAAFFPDGDPALATGGGLSGSRILSAVDLDTFDGSTSYEDTYGHGTRMASVAAGANWSAATGAGGNVADGAAPAASLRVYKISNDSLAGGLASTVTMVSAFQAAVAAPDVAIANMSYGGSPDPEDFLEKSIDAAVLAGVFVTLNAGNSGASIAGAHGSYNALVVGGSYEATKAPVATPSLYFSTYGPLPDGRRYPHMIAQGAYVSCAAMDLESSSMESFGSSPSAAFTAGAAALLLQVDPLLTPLELKAALLNSLAPALGSAAAKGWGYLKVKPAVDLVALGRVVAETIQHGQVKEFLRPAASGETIALTLTWARTGTSLSGSGGRATANLDLEVLDPVSGALALASASLVDGIERLEFSAWTSGTYRVLVRATSGLSGSSATPFALAGVDAHSVDDGAGCAFGAPLGLASATPTQPPSVSLGKNPVLLTGCALSGVTAVSVAGVPLAPGKFTVLDDNHVEVQLPLPSALGPTTVQVSAGAASAQIQLDLAAPSPLLGFGAYPTATGVTFSSTAAALATLAGGPGDIAFVAVSGELVPSSLPGIVDLAIGNGFSSMLLLPTLVVPAKSWLQTSYSFLGGIPFGTPVHFQAALFDVGSGSVPLVPTNVVTGSFLL